MGTQGESWMKAKGDLRVWVHLDKIFLTQEEYFIAYKSSTTQDPSPAPYLGQRFDTFVLLAIMIFSILHTTGNR
jgi:hypothetical protein